ncbi:cation:dicarboxylate symporter family transporter [Streptomyces sp. NPDC003023]|uniref:cation:dicarboxylate symporter family transporter n=1 Tax=Streptomyces sp. NPDC003023 TaxID=3364675 RepID=UPI0036C432F4
MTKGIAGVPSASIVVLFSASTAIGLPAEGVAVLLAVDFVVDMARTALNVAGNSLAAVAMASSEGMFTDPEKAPEKVPAKVLENVPGGSTEDRPTGDRAMRP